MPENLAVENKDDSINQKYWNFGHRSAQDSASKVESLRNSLASVYKMFAEEQKLDAQGITNRINQLEGEKQQELLNKTRIEGQLKSLHQEKKSCSDELKERREGDEFEEDENVLPFVIGTFITILLTIYLFVFYYSSGYSAFYEIGDAKLLNFDFEEIKPLLVLFPIIFLGLGFLINDSLEKNKKREKDGKKKDYVIIMGLLAVTLIADSFIGYKICEQLFVRDHTAMTGDLWEPGMVFKDANFYFILILGFVVYVIWGFLLNYVLSHPYIKSEGQKIKELREKIQEINLKVIEKEADLTNSESIIEQKEKRIIGYKHGVFPVDVNLLKSYISSYMSGWQYYTNGGYPSKAGAINSEALNFQKEWLENKIQSLPTD